MNPNDNGQGGGVPTSDPAGTPAPSMPGSEPTPPTTEPTPAPEAPAPAGEEHPAEQPGGMGGDTSGGAGTPPTA